MEEKRATVFGENVWLVLHDFYSSNIWFTSRTLSNESEKYCSQQYYQLFCHRGNYSMFQLMNSNKIQNSSSLNVVETEKYKDIQTDRQITLHELRKNLLQKYNFNRKFKSITFVIK